MVEITTLTGVGVILMIVLQIFDLGQAYIKNLKKSECCGAVVEMKDSGEKGIHQNTTINEVHNHYESNEVSAEEAEESSKYEHWNK